MAFTAHFLFFNEHVLLKNSSPRTKTNLTVKRHFVEKVFNLYN